MISFKPKHVEPIHSSHNETYMTWRVWRAKVDNTLKAKQSLRLQKINRKMALNALFRTHSIASCSRWPGKAKGAKFVSKLARCRSSYLEDQIMYVPPK